MLRSLSSENTVAGNGGEAIEISAQLATAAGSAMAMAGNSYQPPESQQLAQPARLLAGENNRKLVSENGVENAMLAAGQSALSK